jgi:organic hydroperoxide reductase OsmC/OhrA
LHHPSLNNIGQDGADRLAFEEIQRKSGTGSEPCTSPSEMLAAAVASCMSLMVAREMAGAGLKDKYVKTESPLTLEDKGSHC